MLNVSKMEMPVDGTFQDLENYFNDLDKAIRWNDMERDLIKREREYQEYIANKKQSSK